MADTGAAYESRQLVSVIFSDLVGSTQLGEVLDIEPLRALLLEYFEAMAAVVDSWGGTVDKYIGDAVVAVFGVDASHDDDAVRAIEAGLDMQSRLDEINPALKDRYGVELTMRVGVNTGEVLTSTDSSSVLAGDVFNVAARLQELGKPGSVIVGKRTHNAAQDAFEFEGLGELSIRGKSRPEEVWRVVKRRLGTERSFETEMVGRSAELGMLDALLEQAVSGAKPRLVTILGDAGIGKSRLVREFLSHHSNVVTTLLGHCLPYGSGITYWPLREVLWKTAGIAMDDNSATAASKLQNLIDSMPRGSVSDSDSVAFALAMTAGIALPENPYDELSPESAREELQLAWPVFISAIASQQPTVLVIEDIHWAERPLLDLIEQLALRSLGPLLIVATARPEFVEQQTGWGARAIPSQISLNPLIESSFVRLMALLLPDFDDQSRHRILDSAGGNPFFAEEIARQAVEEGVDSVGSNRMFVPDTARAVLAARIDQIEPADRGVLQDAAVIGEIFWPDVLAEIRGEDVHESLAILERIGLVTSRPTTSLPGRREMAFRHGLMRDVAYQSIPHRRLAPIHAAVAGWTERIAADRREEFVDVIAHHYAAAAQPDTADLAWRDDPQLKDQIRTKAIEALREAGEAARRLFSIDSAVEYADRALALASNDEERLGALELKAASFHAAARADDAWPIYVEAIATARLSGSESDVSRLVTESTLLWARYGGAFTTDDWRQEAVDVVQTRLSEIGEETESLELAALLAGRSVWGRRGIFDRNIAESKADAERAIEISEGLGSQKFLSYALDAYETSSREQGFCGQGDLADRMVKLGSEMVDRRQAHEMLITSAIALAEVGRYEDSRLVGVIAHADAESMGVHQQIHGIRALTAFMVSQGMFAEYLEVSHGLLRLIDDDGGTLCDFGAGALVGLILSLFEQRRPEEGDDALRFFRAALPDKRFKRIAVVEYQLVEGIRPFIGIGQAELLLANVDESVPLHQLYAVKARLPIAVQREDWAGAEQLMASARTLADSCCAPQMLALADWAAGVQNQDISAIQGALGSYTDRYTAARLAVDSLGIIPGTERRNLVSQTEQTLQSMSADATLHELVSLSHM